MSSDELNRTVISVPDPQADWPTIWHFALSINGYETEDISKLAEREELVQQMWENRKLMPDDLLELRLVLFMLQRQHHFWGYDPDEVSAPFVRAVVAQIAEVSGGAVPGPHDFEDYLRAEE